MYAALTTLINRLDSPEMAGVDVIRWGAPVPAFGDLLSATVATVGLNPSNREFLDERGVELQGPHRRFHTLKSLGLRSWSDASAWHLRLILDSCRSYFLGNPYDRWFRKLDFIVGGSGATYYGASSSACHLDLIPYATASKWTDLTFRQRASLLALAADSLALLLRDSSLRVLLLNGASVIEYFQAVAGIRLEREEIFEWMLYRRHSAHVKGFGYKGLLNSLCGVELSHPILVIGYNHNIQSSFGVTTEVVMSIREWVARTAEEQFGETAGSRTR